MTSLMVRIDSKMAQAIYDQVVRELESCAEKQYHHHQMVKDLKRAALADTFMRTGTVVHDDQWMTLYEHPTKGDEAPLMAYHKEVCRFHIDSGFMDYDDPEEILQALRDRVI